MALRGDFGDSGLELKKSSRPTERADDIDMEKFFVAIEKLERRARTMNKAQLNRLNQRLGEAVNQFKKAVTAYICRERPNEPGRFYAGEVVKIAGTGARARIIRFVDAGHLLIEKDDGGRQTVTRDELRKIDFPKVDLRDAGLDPVAERGTVMRKVNMDDAGLGEGRKH